MADSFAKENGVDLRNDKMALQRLKEAAEKAKKELSSAQTTNVNLPFITVNENGPLHMNMDITRAKFEQLTEGLVNRTIGPMNKAMADAGVSNSDISKVITGRRFHQDTGCTGSRKEGDRQGAVQGYKS